ncbi:MAG: UvrD-helicase domain-containing protein [Spirochaetia bacterium]
MRLVADLHVHSRYSRATSREADLDGYHRWARVKGIDIVGTGDFTHPRWLAELSSRLVEKDGLFILKDAPRGSPLEAATPAARDVRFAFTTEISSIYKKRGRVRKVHSLIGVRSLQDARRLSVRLAAIGNIASDGRPILGLDPKDLLSLLLETAEGSFLIPAHIWTPWFSLFGSKSGFDAIEECFEDLTPHIFALETGLSSDPAMNWRWSALDRYRLVSNSDAHSPARLGREANILDVEPSWQGLTAALRTGAGFLGTIEFYPEEGKYHYDGHRKCGVRMDPEETARTGGKCPVCGRPVTVGVLSRVHALADRRAPAQPRPAEGYRSLIPLPEVLAELAGTGSGSRAVAAAYARLIGAFGSELALLLDAPVEDIARSHGPLLAEAIRRMREGKTNPTPGYDGEFGVIRVFDEEELVRLRGQDALFPAPAGEKRKQKDFVDAIPRGAAVMPAAAGPESPPRSAGVLDREQEAIASSAAGRILVAAGPGAGKTRVLVSWIAANRERGPGGVLALTFTARAAAELSERLGTQGIAAHTFHSFCWSVLREHTPGLLSILSPSDRVTVLQILLPREGVSRLRALAQSMERAWEGVEQPDSDVAALIRRYDRTLSDIGAADVSSLVPRALDALRADGPLLSTIRARYRAIAVDELQDINRPQFDLLRLLADGAEAVFCIGDPDQAIYGFRGSDRRLFFDFAGAAGTEAFTLRRNYRSTAAIVSAADGVISADGAREAPSLAAVRPAGAAVRVMTCEDPVHEGRVIASEIRVLVGGIDSVSVDDARTRVPGQYAFSEIAVLARTRAVRDSLLPGLREAGLPLSLGAHAPFSEEEPFRSVLAALRLVLNPGDLVSSRVLSPRAGAVEEILGRGPAILRAASTAGICAALDLVIATIVPLDRSLPEVALGEEVIRSSAARHGTDLAGFLAHASLCTRESEGPGAPERVSLLTFHAAKGLEFPAVFVAGAEEGITPLADRRGTTPSRRGADVGEERRLFYVAVTRARDVLVITHCRRRMSAGRLADARPSRFLDDIPAASRVSESPRVRRDAQIPLF